MCINYARQRCKLAAEYFPSLRICWNIRTWNLCSLCRLGNESIALSYSQPGICEVLSRETSNSFWWMWGSHSSQRSDQYAQPPSTNNFRKPQIPVTCRSNLIFQRKYWTRKLPCSLISRLDISEIVKTFLALLLTQLWTRNLIKFSKSIFHGVGGDFFYEQLSNLDK